MARINAMTKTAETATQASEVFKAVAHNITRNGKPVDNAFAAVLMDSTGAIVDQLSFEIFSSAAKAEAAGLEHWPQAAIDIDTLTAQFEERLKAKIPKMVAAERKRLQLLQAARQLVADGEADNIEDATKRLKSEAKANKTGDDDNVLADLTAE